MTIHSSKGLEFPVVVLMFLESSGTGGAKGGSVIV
jgi:ATP-dependent exoDNAse (exonuclease V) beta subunit